MAACSPLAWGPWRYPIKLVATSTMSILRMMTPGCTGVGCYYRRLIPGRQGCSLIYGGKIESQLSGAVDDEDAYQSSLHALAHALISLYPLAILSDPSGHRWAFRRFPIQKLIAGRCSSMMPMLVGQYIHGWRIGSWGIFSGRLMRCWLGIGSRRGVRRIFIHHNLVRGIVCCIRRSRLRS